MRKRERNTADLCTFPPLGLHEAGSDPHRFHHLVALRRHGHPQREQPYRARVDQHDSLRHHLRRRRDRRPDATAPRRLAGVLVSKRAELLLLAARREISDFWMFGCLDFILFPFVDQVSWQALCIIALS
jgi:hypothetical protein